MMAPAETFQDLVVWQKAHQFVLATYDLTGKFPKSETYGLVSQMRRAGVSIAANIAEGFKNRAMRISSGFLILRKVPRRNRDIILFWQKILNTGMSD